MPDHSVHDLTQPLRISRDGDIEAGLADHHAKRFDLISCLEVAEHLPLDSHQTLVDTIVRHLRYKPNMDDASGYLLFSAAPPGQGGEHHIGCRPAVQWRGMFYERGISYRDDLTRQLSHLFGYVTGPATHWLAANLQVFDRGMQ